MTRQYIGARYVPIIDGEYNSEKVYEPLTIVTYNGSSYTSKKTVPAGTLPTNTEFWALTGNYNAQVEAYREEVERRTEHIATVSPMSYGAVGDGVTDDSAAVALAGAAGIIEDIEHEFYLGSDVEVLYGCVNTRFKYGNDVKMYTSSAKVFSFNTFRGIESTLDGERGTYLLALSSDDNCAIIGNTFKDTKNAVHITGSSGVKILGNTFNNLIQTAPTTGGNGYGIVTVASDNMIIEGNLFKDVNRHCVYLSIEGTSRGSENVVINGNIFNYESVPTITPYELPIQTRNVKNLTVDSNIFNKTNGIICIIAQTSGSDTTSKYINITNNKCYDIHNAARENVDGLLYFSPAGGTCEHVRFEHNYIRATKQPIAKLSGVTNITFCDNEYVSIDGTAAFIFDDSDANYGLTIDRNKITLTGVDSNLIFSNPSCTKWGRVNIIGNTLVMSHFLYIASNLTRIGNLDIHGNTYTMDVERDYLNSAPINEVKCYNNVGNIHKWINGVPTAYITTDDANNVAFADTPAALLACASTVPNSGGIGDGTKYLPNVVFNHNNFTSATLPTTGVKVGQISTTSDGNAYIFNGSAWKILT